MEFHPAMLPIFYTMSLWSHFPLQIVIINPPHRPPFLLLISYGNPSWAIFSKAELVQRYIYLLALTNNVASTVSWSHQRKKKIRCMIPSRLPKCLSHLGYGLYTVDCISWYSSTTRLSSMQIQMDSNDRKCVNTPQPYWLH